MYIYYILYILHIIYITYYIYYILYILHIIYIITYTLNLLKQIGFEDDEIAKFGICPSSSAENGFSDVDLTDLDVGVINRESPIAGWFVMDNPTKMDDLGVPPC